MIIRFLCFFVTKITWGQPSITLKLPLPVKQVLPSYIALQKNFDFYRWAQWNISKKLRDYNSKSKRFFAAKSGIKQELSNCNNNCFLEDKEVELERNIIYKQLFSDANDLLSKREKRVVIDNLILGKRLKETAKNLNLSTERIRQIRNCSLYKIKRSLS